MLSFTWPVSLPGDQAGGEGSREERAFELLREIGQSADMVLVTVSQDDSREPFLLHLDELEVGEDQLDPRIVGAGEIEAQIDHDPLAATAIEIDVHADLARAAERTEQELFSGDHFEARAAMSYNRLNPWMVRSGSIASNASVCLSNSVARPPVAMTLVGAPISRFIRSVSPSIIAT